MINELLESKTVLEKNKSIIIIPLIESIFSTFLFVIYALLAIVGGVIITASTSNLVITIAYVIAAFVGLIIIQTAVNAFFTSMLTGAVDLVNKGKKLENDMYPKLGLKRFHRMFKAFLAIGTLHAILLITILPAALVFKTNPAIAAGLGAISIATIMCVALIIGFASKPITYQIALSEGKLKTDLEKSINYFKTNIITTSSMIFTISMLISLTYAPFSLIVGFFRLLDLFVAPIGSIMGAIISIPILLTITALAKTIETIWWMKIIKK